MVNFLLLIENNINYTKKIIDSGQTPQIVFELCSCIRETFCLSYSIRKTNFLYLFFQKRNTLIKFDGANLRYLGPDERSQALLLEKALNKVKNENKVKNDIWIKSTPGIYVRKFFDTSSFIDFYRSIALGKSIILTDNSYILEENVEEFNLNKTVIKIMENDFFIIPIYTITTKNFRIIELIKEVKNIKLLSLSKIKKVENKILYINFRKDQQRTL